MSDRQRSQPKSPRPSAARLAPRSVEQKASAKPLPQELNMRPLRARPASRPPVFSARFLAALRGVTTRGRGRFGPQSGLRRAVLWIGNLLALGVISLIIIGLLGVTGYVMIAAQLPPAEEMRLRSLQFATTQILDRNGKLLWEIIDPTGGRRVDVTLDQISPAMVEATIATEDRYFYLNVGVDPIAITRAVYDNLSERQIVSGASTITQQLARNIFLEPQERTEKSFLRKLREAVLAVEISRRYTKTQILEVYFNQIYYGNLAYGVEAAAQTYFGKPARDLTLPEAAMLAGLPQSPATLDPYLNPEGAKARQQIVLGLMVEAGYLTSGEADQAAATPLTFRDPQFPLEAPHFVGMVREELERIIPPAYLYQAGLRVYTTLDSDIQTAAEIAVRERVEALAGHQVTNGALVTLEAKTGQILALVGSKDFRDSTIEGQVNMVTSLRQPASTIKPLLYLTAFERLGWTPSTLLMDVPVEYPDEFGNIYRPTNRDHQFYGPVTIRTALANSLNIPAVKTLEQLGISSLKDTATRLGISSLKGDDYGLSLALGSGEVSLLEMTGAYQALANEGIQLKPTSILKITDSFDREIFPDRPQPRRVINEAHAYLISHILSDREARMEEFDPDQLLTLSRPAAVKTGTTNDWRDSWTIGYTPDFVTGVWVGNANNEPMQAIDGLTGAGTIWHRFMEEILQDEPLREFPRPPTITELEVCADTGTLPSAVCPETRSEIFFRDQPPLGPEHDLHQLVEIDRATNLRVNEFCRANIVEKYYLVLPPEARAWATSHGLEQPPLEFCPSSNLRARIAAPIDNVSVRGTINIEGLMIAPPISYYQLELGTGTNPEKFIVIQSRTYELARRRQLLGTFDTTQVENGPYTLRLVVSDQIGGSTDDRVRILIDNPSDAIQLRRPVTTPPATVTPTPDPNRPPTSTPVPTRVAGDLIHLPVDAPPATPASETIFSPTPPSPPEFQPGLITGPVVIPPQSGPP